VELVNSVKPADKATATATGDATNGYVYKTAGGALTVGGTYNVVVKVVKGGPAPTTATTLSPTIPRRAADFAKRVDYRSVKHNEKTTVENHDSSNTSTEPSAMKAADAVSISAKVATTNAAGAGEAIAQNAATGTPVLQGTKVTFTAGDWTAAKDYKLDWYEAATKKDSGKDHTQLTYDRTYGDAAIGIIGGKLEQQTYTVPVTVGAGITSVTLTADNDGNKAYTTPEAFGGTAETKNIVVPAGDYTITYVKANGTTVKAITKVENGGTATDATTTLKMNLAVASTKNSLKIETETAKWQLSMLTGAAVVAPGDATWAGATNVTVSGTATTATPVTKTEKAMERDYGWTDLANDKIVVTLKNTGNEVLHNVKLTAPSGDYVVVSADTNSFAPSGTIATLAVGATATYTVQLKNENAGTKTPVSATGTDYKFTAAFKKAAADGTDASSLIFNQPVTIKAVAVTTVTGKVGAATTEIDALLKSGNTVAELLTTGMPGTLTLTAADVDYQWYRVPHGTSAITLTNGVPNGGTVAGAAGASYTLTDEDNGFDLVLVAKAKTSGNATGAAVSKRYAVGYPAGVTVKENATATTAQNNYKVFLVEKDYAPANILVTIDTKVIPLTVFAAGVYSTDSDTLLDPAKSYDVWTNIVAGTVAKHTDFRKDTTATITGVDDTTNHKGTAEVVYRQVKYAANATIKNTYAALDNTANAFIADDDATHTVAAKADLTPGTELWVNTDLDVANNGYVLAGTTVNFKVTKWDKDYDLSWTGGITAENANTTSTADAVQRGTYTTSLAEVKTELALHLYNVAAHVVGDGGAVTELTITDGNNAFTT
ncbi:MAG: hypothetical protein RSB55_07215, partial [Oscillospiraceae bacterium]